MRLRHKLAALLTRWALCLDPTNATIRRAALEALDARNLAQEKEFSDGFSQIDWVKRDIEGGREDCDHMNVLCEVHDIEDRPYRVCSRCRARVYIPRAEHKRGLIPFDGTK
jgi:hypothetical protein